MPKLTPREKAYRKKQRLKKKLTNVADLKAMDERLKYLLEKD